MKAGTRVFSQSMQVRVENIGTTTAFVASVQTTVWLFVTQGASIWVAVIVSILGGILLLYRMRSEYLRDVRAGIHVFRRSSKQPRPQKIHSHIQLYESMRDAYAVQDYHRMDEIVKVYNELHFPKEITHD